MSKREIAMDYFTQGYNCSQSVLLAFKEECGLSEEELARIAFPFGGGISRLRSVCGSVSGMLMAFGLIFGESKVPSGELKGKLYEEGQKLVNEFKEKNGSFICSELLSGANVTVGAHPEERTPEYYKKRPCRELAGDAAEILEKYLLFSDHSDILSNVQ